MSTMSIVSFAFFFSITTSGLMWLISQSVWMVKSRNTVTSSFSSALLGECLYHLSLHSTLYSLHTSHCMTRPTTSCLLCSVHASLGQLHKICCTVSLWLPHIPHLDDTFWFSILAFTVFVLSAWSCAAKVSPSVSFFNSPVLIQFQETPDKSYVSLLICSCSCFPDQSSVLFIFILSWHYFGVSISSTFFLFLAVFNTLGSGWCRHRYFVSSVFMASSTVISPRPLSPLGKYPGGNLIKILVRFLIRFLLRSYLTS